MFQIHWLLAVVQLVFMADKDILAALSMMSVFITVPFHCQRYIPLLLKVGGLNLVQ